MRNLVFLVFLALVVFLITGWFMDWYSLTSVGSAGGKQQFQFELDTAKIKQDLSKGRDKFNQTVENVRKEVPTKAAPTSAVHF